MKGSAAQSQPLSKKTSSTQILRSLKSVRERDDHGGFQLPKQLCTEPDTSHLLHWASQSAVDGTYERIILAISPFKWHVNGLLLC